MYCGFEVHTVDMFFECHVKDFIGVHAEDDAAEIVIVKKEELKAEEFGLMSIRRLLDFTKKTTVNFHRFIYQLTIRGRNIPSFLFSVLQFLYHILFIRFFSKKEDI